MIVKHTFLDKCNTIIDGSKANFGLNPIIELYYGNLHSRALIHFGHDELKQMVEDKTYPDMSKLRHVLKMKNASMIRTENLNRCCLDITRKDERIRAASYDIILFLIPEYWDNGKGFDYSQDIFPGFHRGYSEEGSNWYYRKSYCTWGLYNDESPCEKRRGLDNYDINFKLAPGVYSIETMFKEMEKYCQQDSSDDSSEEDCIIVGMQHFDYGNEDLCIDITETVNRFITGELENYGLGIAFGPTYEIAEEDTPQYSGFFSNSTKSFFQPYVETTYDDYIRDDRNNFHLDKENRLYFYASVGGDMVNLDNIPSCSVNGAEYEVKQATKGVYYIELYFDSSEYAENTMFYDTWSNIVYNGKHLKDVELYFTTKSGDGFYSFGLPSGGKEYFRVVPSLSGIDNKETINRGDVRKVNVDCRIPYTSDQSSYTGDIEYRLYVLQGTSEIDVIPYTKVEMAFLENYFLIDTRQLVTCRYYIDIKVKNNMEDIIHKEMLQFDIADNRTDARG